MRKLSLVAAAVAVALGTGIAQADQPTLAAIQAALPVAQGGNGTAKLFFIAGSSAAKNATKAFITANVCGGAISSYQSSFTGSVPDFNAWACTATAGPTAGSLTVFYYRAEGGSVVGVYPVINNKAIKQLDLSAANTTCPAAAGGGNCAVAGTSGANGPNDSWGPAGVAGSGKANSAPLVAPDLGISDLEPDAFVGNNSPYASPPPPAGIGYDPGTFGAAQSQTALHGLAHKPIFQQTFGMVVNNGIAQTNLGKSAIGNVLNGNYTDWANVPDVNSATPGAAVSAGSKPIFVCNREIGSGTRTSADIFFLGDHCAAGATSISENGGGAIHDNFSTGELLTCVQTNGTSAGAAAGFTAIGYASVDNNTAAKLGGLAHFVSINGVAPTNYNSAIGAYDYAYEATANTNTGSTNPVAAGMITFLVPKLQAVATAPQSAQVNALPGIAGNNAALPLVPQGATPIYVTDFARNAAVGNSCTALTEQN